MNNVVNMVNYYLLHKNADDSVIDYIKNKLNISKLDELIIIQIELLYTDPSDKLVSGLVSFINDRINSLLSDIQLDELINLISILKGKVSILECEIKEKEKNNKDIFGKIKTKDLNNDNIFDNEDNLIASKLINDTENNIFVVNRNKSIINSINIWINNLENSYRKKISKSNIEDLLKSYIGLLSIINRDKFINNYIKEISIKIDEYILNSNILDTIVNIMPELDLIYKNNSHSRNEIYKLLDYYIDMAENKIKDSIRNMYYEEKLILKDKINIICKEIEENDNPDDDFKILVISSYIRYL